MPSAEAAPSVFISAPYPSFSSGSESKAAVRCWARLRRAEAFACGGAAAGIAVSVLARTAGVLPDVGAGAVVAGYWPVRGELDCRPLLTELAAMGWCCALPVVVHDDAPLVFRCWHPGAPLEFGRFGIPQPSERQAAITPRVVLVPLLAFDRGGQRLGQGAGFYDRTLADLRRRHPVQAIGLAFAAQEYPGLPAEPHDQRLDWIVTEAEVYQVR